MSVFFFVLNQGEVFFENFVKEKVISKIPTNISYKNPSVELQYPFFNVVIDDIQVDDIEKKPLVQVEDLNIKIDLLDFLLSGFKKIELVQAQKVRFNAKRYANRNWNFRFLSTSKEARNLYVDKILMPVIELNIADEALAANINYQDIFLEIHGFGQKVSNVRLNSHPEYTADTKNYFEVAGSLGINNFQDLIECLPKLSIKFQNIDPIALRFVLSFLDVENKYNRQILSLLSRYPLSLNFNQIKTDKQKELMNIEANLAGLLNFKTLFSLDKDINIVDFKFRYQDFIVDIAGEIKDWAKQKSNIMMKLFLDQQHLLDISGYAAFKDNKIDLKFENQDIKIKDHLGLLNKIIAYKMDKKYLLDALNTGGSLYFSANYVSDFSSINDFDADLNLKDLSLTFSTYPFNLSKLNTQIKISNDLIQITKNSGYIVNNYFENKLNYNLKNKSIELLKFAASKIRLESIELLSYFDLQIKNLAGTLKDIYLDYDSAKNTFYFRSSFEQVAIANETKVLIENLNGDFNYNGEFFDFKNLSLQSGFNSLLTLNGIYKADLPFNQQKVKLEAKNIDVTNIFSIIDPYIENDFIISGGRADLSLDPQSGILSALVKSMNFIVLKNDKFIYPFMNWNFTAEVSDDIKITNADGYYGSSNFKDMNFVLEDYKNTNPDFGVEFSSNLKFNEITNFFPRSLNSYLLASGRLPLKATVTGNKIKKDFELVADLNNFDEIKFSNWFKANPYDNGQPMNLSFNSKFIVTDHLIVSEDSNLIFTNRNKAEKTILKTHFQVSDYNDKNKFNYYLRFKTLDDANGNAHLNLIEPHFVSIQNLNLDVDEGNFVCDTFSTYFDRQTICDIHFQKATAKNFGIGDLKATDVQVDLLSVSGKPLDAAFQFAKANWNTIPIEDIIFDLRAIGSYIFIKDLSANLDGGKVFADTTINFLTEESNFKIKGTNLPAYHLAQGIWGLGEEISVGRVAGEFIGKTRGLEMEQMFNELEAKANIIVRDGQLSTLKSLQRILTAVNTMRNFDLNNVMQSLVNYKSGLFKFALSSIEYAKGTIKTKKLLLKAPQIELDLKGSVDFTNDQLDLTGSGLIPKYSKSILNSIGVGSFNLGNLVLPINKGKRRFFSYEVVGPISDPDRLAESLKSNFAWSDSLEKIGDNN